VRVSASGDGSHVSLVAARRRVSHGRATLVRPGLTARLVRLVHRQARLLPRQLSTSILSTLAAKARVGRPVSVSGGIPIGECEDLTAREMKSSQEESGLGCHHRRTIARVIVRPEEPDDRAAITAATEAAFGRTAEARMVDAILGVRSVCSSALAGRRRVRQVSWACHSQMSRLTLARGCWSSGRSACVLSARGKGSAAIWFALRLGLLTS
jgi:hypothetical protein